MAIHKSLMDAINAKVAASAASNAVFDPVSEAGEAGGGSSAAAVSPERRTSRSAGGGGGGSDADGATSDGTSAQMRTSITWATGLEMGPAEGGGGGGRVSRDDASSTHSGLARVSRVSSRSSHSPVSLRGSAVSLRSLGVTSGRSRSLAATTAIRAQRAFTTSTSDRRVLVSFLLHGACDFHGRTDLNECCFATSSHATHSLQSRTCPPLCSRRRCPGASPPASRRSSLRKPTKRRDPQTHALLA